MAKQGNGISRRLMLVVAIVLETNDPALAQTIGQAVFNAALQPNP